MGGDYTAKQQAQCGKTQNTPQGVRIKMKSHTEKEIMKTTERITTPRARHHAALKSLHAVPETADGLKMWRKLRRLENRAHSLAEAYCNAETTEDHIDAYGETLGRGVAAVFGGRLPDGFLWNLDPRGYALKIRGPEAGRPCGFIPDGMHTDWGGNGILAPLMD